MVLLMCLLVLSLQFTTCQYTVCHTGHKWDLEKKICTFCDDGTFMQEKDHYHTECFPCAKVRNKSTEYVIRECSFEENALIGSYRQTDMNSCPSDRFYVHVSRDGEKVCRMRTKPCKQGQYFLSGDKCVPCSPGTYMVDDHHSNTACNSCRQLLHNQEVDSYVATTCNITRNSTSMTDGLPADTASFNCSHLSEVYKNCLGEEMHHVHMNKTSNSTDPLCATLTERNMDGVFHVLLITAVVFLLVLSILLLLNNYVTKTNKLYLSLMNYLEDKQGTLGKFLIIFLVVLAVCMLPVLIVESKESAAVILIFLLKFVGVLCMCFVIVIAILYMLLCDFHLSTETSSGCDQRLTQFDHEQNGAT